MYQQCRFSHYPQSHAHDFQGKICWKSAVYPSKMTQPREWHSPANDATHSWINSFLHSSCNLVLSWLLSPAKNLPRGNCTLLCSFPWLRVDYYSYHSNLVCPSHGSLRKRVLNLKILLTDSFHQQPTKYLPSFPLSVVINDKSPLFCGFLVWFGWCLVWLVFGFGLLWGFVCLSVFKRGNKQGFF